MALRQFDEIDDFVSSLDEKTRSDKEIEKIRKKINIVKDSKNSESADILIKKFNENPSNTNILLEICESYFSDEEYELCGAKINENLNECSIIFGVKEIDPNILINNRTYLFFSHTFKINKQQKNIEKHKKDLLLSILNKKITLIDYENIRGKNGTRCLGFGRFAGIVGCYNTLNLLLKVLGKQSLASAYKIDDYDKGKFKYFMHKEIHEQIDTIRNTITGRTKKDSIMLHGLLDYWPEIKQADKIFITACGTSWHAGLIGKNLIERFAEVPVHVEYASEFRYNKTLVDNKSVVIAISQSGETADTLAAIKKANDYGAITVGICNVPGSSVSRETNCGIFTRCGHEIGVASTKAFTAQISILYLLALKLADSNDTMSKKAIKGHLDYDEGIKKIKNILNKENEIKKIALKYKNANDFLYLGRGLNFPVALEGALKLKEISYIHAEGYPAAEMKHGPIALVDKDMPNVFIVPKDKTYEKIISNIEEIKSRKGKIIIVTDSKDKILKDLANDLIYVPKTNHYMFCVLATIVLQLFAYYIAVGKKLNVDRPRNLAKSVTVE